MQKMYQLIFLPLCPRISLVDCLALFDPNSKLARYTDIGNCGFRGDDAKADTSDCPNGATRVCNIDEQTERYTINVCKYYAFEVVECIAAQPPVSPTTKPIFSPSNAPTQCFSAYEEKSQALDCTMDRLLKETKLLHELGSNIRDVDMQIERIQDSSKEECLERE